MFKFLSNFWECIEYYRCEVDKHDRDLFFSIKEDILKQGFIRTDWDNLKHKYQVQYYNHYSQEKINRIFNQAFQSAFVDYSM